MKFGELFDTIGVGFKSLTNSMNKFMATQNNSRSTGRGSAVLPDYDAIKKEMESFDDELDKIAINLEVTNSKIKAAIDTGNKARLKEAQDEREGLRRQSVAKEDEIKGLESKREKQEKKYHDTKMKELFGEKKRLDTLEDLESNYSKQLDSLLDEYRNGAIDLKEFNKSLKELDFNTKINKKLAFLNTDAKGQFDIFSNTISNGFGNFIKSAGAIPAQFGFMIGIIVDLTKKAFQQIWELNKTVIELERSTGGMVTAASMGVDEMGNFTNSNESLRTSLIKANLDEKNFSEATDKLFQGGFGQIAGMKTNLKTSGEEMVRFGIEAGKMKKLWGVDITKAVQGFTMNWGKSVDEATDITKKFAFSAKEMGFDMRFATEQLEKLTNMTGKYYFRSTQNMTKLAMFATKLGTNVETLLDASDRMTSITDLFENQQKMMALGLSSYAGDLAKIYAAKITGSYDVAARTTMFSLLKDMRQFGKTKEGGLSGQAMATLKAAGFSEDLIKNMNRVSIGMRQLHVTEEQYNKYLAGDKSLDKLTAQRIADYEYNNRTLEEQLDITFKSIKQVFIDPLAQSIGPLVKGLLDVIAAFADFITPLLKFVLNFPLFTWIFKFLGGVLKGIAEGLKKVGELFVGLGKAFAWAKPIIESIGHFLEKAGKYIGFILTPIFVHLGMIIIAKVVTALLRFSAVLLMEGLNAIKTFALNTKAAARGMGGGGGAGGLGFLAMLGMGGKTAGKKAVSTVAIEEGGWLLRGVGWIGKALGRLLPIVGWILWAVTIYDLLSDWFGWSKEKSEEDKSKEDFSRVPTETWKDIFGNTGTAGTLPTPTTPASPMSTTYWRDMSKEQERSYTKGRAAENINTQGIKVNVQVKNEHGFFGTVTQAKAIMK